jgi:hypothetical protein
MTESPVFEVEGKIRVADEYVIAIHECLSASREGLFAAGDIMIDLLDRHGRSRVEPVMQYLSGVLSVKKKQLYDYVNTSRRWSPEQRVQYPKFEWTVFRNSDPIRDKELLDQAHDEGANASEIKRRLFPNLESPVKLLRDATGALFKLLENRQLDDAFQNEIADIYKRLLEIYSELDSFGF